MRKPIVATNPVAPENSNKNNKNRKQIADRVRIGSYVRFGRLGGISLFIAVMFWLFEGGLHAYAFHESSFASQIIPSNLHELWMRSLVFFAIVTFGFYAQFLINKCEINERKAASAHAELEQVFEAAADGMRVIDKQYNVLKVNKTFALLSGIDIANNIGKKCYETFHGSLCHSSDCPLRRIVKGADRIECDVRKKRSDSIIVPCVLTATPFRGPDGELLGIVEHFKNVMNHRQTEKALASSEQKYKSLTENIDIGIYRHSVKCSGGFTEVNPALINMFGYHDKEEFLELKIHDLFCSSKDKEEIDEILKEYGSVKREIKLKKNDGTQFIAFVSAMPVYDENDRIVYYDGIVADITERKQAEESLQRSLWKLRRSTEGTIKAMARVVEKIDPYTAGHQRGVAQLACAIAEDLELPKDKIEGIHVASLIHDIGKIAVPPQILNKPGELSEREYAMIKEHPKVAYEILKAIDFPWPIAEIVLQHHERIDGSGYPRGLKGEEIIIEARIIAVADIVEALASDRPYRSALTKDRILREVIRYKGVRYEERIVDICLGILAKKGFQFDHICYAYNSLSRTCLRS